MGVPKFFRWISERYPKVNQRYGSPPNPETFEKYFESLPPTPSSVSSSASSSSSSSDLPDPLSTCGFPPPIDRLYIDMNGIIHGCSHSNNDETEELESNDETSTITNGTSTSLPVSQEEIFRNVAYYLDRIIGDIVQPTEIVYMAIDGVAPRAKLNQQRSRRYRSGQEGQIETSIYEAHARKLAAAAAERQSFDNNHNEEMEDFQDVDFDQTNNNFLWGRLGSKVFTTAHYKSNVGTSPGPTISPFTMDDGFSYLSSNENDANKSSPLTSTAASSSSASRTSRHMSNDDNHHEGTLQEVAPGRFKGKVETKLIVENPASEYSTSSSSSDSTTNDNTANAKDPFHSNVITPGTPFFQEFTRNLEHFIQHKLSTDPKWQGLTIILSGPNVPGEGEHKIMDFIRAEKQRPNYNPNLRHCVVGQDGDLIMLGLATHEPNLVLLRERVIFNMAKKRIISATAPAKTTGTTTETATASTKGKDEKSLSLASTSTPKSTTSLSLDSYLNNAHFEFLHMGVLRDYLAFEFETSNVLPTSPWDLERTIDDFVFMTFFVGNDFLPHMPALDISDQAFDLLFYAYKTSRTQWLEDYQNGKSDTLPYLTYAGNIVSGRRLEDFLAMVGGHEVSYYEKKKQQAPSERKRLVRAYKRYGWDGKRETSLTMPDLDLVASKEESDRAAYRTMLLLERAELANTTSLEETEAERQPQTQGFSPVMTGQFQPAFEVHREEMDEGLISRMTSLLQNSLGSTIIAGKGKESNEENLIAQAASGIDDQDLKGRYYYDKFQFTPFDEDKHVELRKKYIEGLVWTLKYYYEGCPSWEWYFPYHYGPMLSDLVNLDEILQGVTFEGKMGSPLKPFEQLMGCMPPSQARHLPEPYRWLMTDPKSPIIDFYPRSFTVDMNGKRWPWEAVTLLPFIDSKRLLEAVALVDESQLNPNEKERNSIGEAIVFQFDSLQSSRLPGIRDAEGFRALDENKAKITPFVEATVCYSPPTKPVLKPELTAGITVPVAGFATLRDAPIQSLWRRKLGVDVFSSRSRYKTSCLEMYNMMPPLPPIESLGPKLIGTCVFINYPYFLEGLVTAISDETVTVRGRNPPRKWSQREADAWRIRRDGAIRKYLVGEGLTGTGGMIIPDDQPITLSIRPFEKVVLLDDGRQAKKYAKFEVDVPLLSTFWNPSIVDPRLEIPAMLEKDAFEIAAPNLVDSFSKRSPKQGSKRSLFPPRIPPATVQAAFSTNVNAKVFKGEGRNFSSHVANAFPIRGGLVGKGLLVDSAAPWTVGGMHTSSWRSNSRLQASAKLGVRGHRAHLLSVGFVFASFLLGGTTSTTSFPLVSSYEVVTAPTGSSKQKGGRAIAPPGLYNLADLRGGDISNDAVFQFDSPPPPALEFAHGTTTLAFVFQGGIIAAVDSRASLGSFVGSKTTQKVLPVNSHILGTMAGGAADCMFWIRNLKAKALLHELSWGARMTVARASRLLSNELFAKRGSNLSVGTMIMGYDESGPPRIFYIDDSGKRIEGNMFAVGSGSTFALGILDNEWQTSMTDEQAIALAIKAIRHATFRDAFSGGFVNVYLIKNDGWRKVYTEDMARFI